MILSVCRFLLLSLRTEFEGFSIGVCLCVGFSECVMCCVVSFVVAVICCILLCVCGCVCLCGKVESTFAFTSKSQSAPKHNIHHVMSCFHIMITSSCRVCVCVFFYISILCADRFAFNRSLDIVFFCRRRQPVWISWPSERLPSPSR